MKFLAFIPIGALPPFFDPPFFKARCDPNEEFIIQNPLGARRNPQPFAGHTLKIVQLRGLEGSDG